jgi:hypothetical protein
LLPELGVCRLEETQIGKNGGKALTDTGWHWLCTPAPFLVLLGFCDFSQNNAALRHAVCSLSLMRQPARMPTAYAPNPVKQGIRPPGPQRQGDTD